MAGASTSAHSPVELTIDILYNLETSIQDAVCIYSVPSTLRQINSEAYTPQVISIGPIHHGKPNLQAMEIQKKRYLKEFCKRKLRNEHIGTHLDEETIKEKEMLILKEFSTDLLNKINAENTLRCYADNFDFRSPMILLDSVFILELFLRHHYEGPENEKDFIISKPWLSIDVQKDLILLENQLPFSILEKLYDFAKPKLVNGQEIPSFLELTCKYFSYCNPKKVRISANGNILHFTDLVRQFWISNRPPPMEDRCIASLCTITKLCQAGLKLKPADADGKCYLDINFDKGISCLCRAELQIPCFEVDDITEFIVRNLMALEQCHYPRDTYICNYIRLWDLLIDTAPDVDLLVQKKILINGLGDSAAVANLLNRLCNQVAEVKSCYYTLSKDMNEYYENCCNHTLAKLKSTYFGDLWTGTGTVAAILVVIFTAIQAVCSILPLLAPKKFPK